MSKLKNVIAGMTGRQVELASSTESGLTETIKTHSSNLYIERRVQNLEDIFAWAKSVGITEQVLEAHERNPLHVTIAYSTKPVVWGELLTLNNAIELTGGQRKITKFNEEATVLEITSTILQSRFKAILEAGASYDFDTYRPHITLAIRDTDWGSIPPYSGSIVLGPELFAAIK